MKSSEWLREHAADPFVQRAKAQGWRSRAVFKLKEIDERERLLKRGQLCVDLGAAPGAWSQYAARKVGRSGRVIATDVLPLAPLPGVEFVVGDFREQAVERAILERLGQGLADVILSDMAANFTGIDAVDQPRAMDLAQLALDFASRVLNPRGAALIKVFQGSGFTELRAEARRRFGEVRLVKPGASRTRSAELYLLAKHRLLV